MKFVTKIFSLAILFCLSGNLLMAQTADELFAAARRKAFEDKNYPSAIQLANQALIKSPDYTEIHVFLGRLYTWDKKPDSARMEFNIAIKQKTAYEDAYLGLATLEYWNDNTGETMRVVDNGLSNAGISSPLLLLKSKLLIDLKNWKAADSVITILLKNDPKNTEARALATKIRDNSAVNKVGINYDYVHFDKQFKDPWHLLSIDYGRQTSLGPVIGRVNYANRFNSDGLQFELDAYPHLAKKLQAYMNIGYSPDLGIFPRYKAGLSLYANLAAGFEIEGGFRYLRFSENTWIYTAAVGKYYRNFWFNLRAYLTPSENTLSQSFGFNTRYYLGGADDYLSLGLSTGLSPDERRNNILVNTVNYKLKSNGIALGFRKSVKTLNVINLKVALENQEYFTDTKGNQLSLSIGFIRRF